MRHRLNGYWSAVVNPYYQDDYVTIYNCDCSVGLAELSANSVDLVLTDPPYLIQAESCGFDGGRTFLARIKNDGFADSFDFNLLDVYKAKLKTLNIISFCNKYQFSQYLAWIEANRCSWQLITWHKTGCIPFKHHYLPDTEYAFHIWDRLPIRDERHGKSYFVTPVNKTGFNHPTVKPESIVSKLILGTTDKGQTVLDPFLGSGTTAICAKKLGRKCIGFEILEKYAEMAAKRCSQQAFDIVTDNQKKCYVCGNVISGKRVDSDYCSARCRQKAYRHRCNANVTDNKEVAMCL